jgi:hypothetical protein
MTDEIISYNYRIALEAQSSTRGYFRGHVLADQYVRGRGSAAWGSGAGKPRRRRTGAVYPE